MNTDAVFALHPGRCCGGDPQVRLSRTQQRSLCRTWTVCWVLVYLMALLPLSTSHTPPAETSAKSPPQGTGDVPAAPGSAAEAARRDGTAVAAEAPAKAVGVRPSAITDSPGALARKGEWEEAGNASVGNTGETVNGENSSRRTSAATEVPATASGPLSPAAAFNQDPQAALSKAGSRRPRGVPPSGFSKRAAASASAPAPSPSSGSGDGLGRHYNFTLAFLTAVQNNGPGKFTAGAFFLALDHLNKATEERLEGSQHSATFHYVFRDTHNEEQTATRAMVDLYCNDDEHVSAFIGPDVFCNSAALLATSFDLPYLTFDCNDIHMLRTNIHKFLMVNLEPSLAYVAKSIVAVMRHFHWTSFWLITGTGVTTNDWIDTGQELRHHARKEGITLIDRTMENLNDRYHTINKDKKPYRTVIEETRYKTRVYVFLGDYNSLLAFLQELNSAGVTAGGEHVVIAVDDTPLLSTSYLNDSPGRSNYFLSTEDTGQKVTPSRLDAFRNVLLLTRQEPTNNVTEEFRYHVYERNYGPPIHLKRIPEWWPGKKQHDLLQESVYLYDAVMHYGNVVMDLIQSGQDPYNASLVSQRMRNVDIESVQGFKIHVNQDGESEGRYVLRGLAYDGAGRALQRLWQVGSFSMHSGTPVYRPSNTSFLTWVSGRVPVSEPPCGFDGSKCGGAAEMSGWKLIAVGIGLAVMAVVVLGAVFVGLRYWLMVRRMRRQALAAARVGCTNSFMELQEQDREGLLVC